MFGELRDVFVLLTLMSVFDSVFTLAYPEVCFIILGNVSAFEKLNISLISPILISGIFHPRDVKLCHGFVPRNSISGMCLLQGSMENLLQCLTGLWSPVLLIFCVGRIE